MAFNRVRRFFRQIMRFLRRLKDEARLFTRSIGEVIRYLIDRGIMFIQLKYHCLQVRKRMCEVRSYTEWESYARLLDHLEGTVDWKYILKSDHYEYVRLEARRNMMKQLRSNSNTKTLAYCIRQDLSKNICNISDPQLYNQCHVGTKRAIEKYIEEVIKCVKMIYMADPNSMTIESKLEFFAETRHAYGRTALLLSGGATFGKFHFGLLKALYEQDLFPRTVCGSSAGSLVFSMMASAPYNEMGRFFDPKVAFGKPMLGRFTTSKLQFFIDLFSGKIVFDTEVLKQAIYQHCGDLTFKEIFQRFGWNLNITVTDFSMTQAPRLLNYLTAPNVLVWSATVASCAIPGMFATVELMQKLDDGSIIQYDPSSYRMQFVDGSVGSDLPMQRLTELFNVNTFIVSQVNPHVCPFVSVDTGQVLDTALQKRFLRTMKEVTGNTLKFLLRQTEAIGLLPQYIKGLADIIMQSYKGHVTIVPSPTLSDYWNIFTNITPESYQRSFQSMYVQSLRKMARIKSYFAIEREFDRYYDLLKSQLRDGSGFTDIHDEDELRIQALRTFDKSKAWDNPLLHIPIEKAHLNVKHHDNPQLYEQLCVKHESIEVIDKTPAGANASEIQQLDPSMLEFFLEKPIEHWDAVSLQFLTQSLANPETRATLTMYLQSKPVKQEVRLIKELMLDSLKQSNHIPEVNPLHSNENLRRNMSLVSLLTDNSAAHDVQLAYYAKVIENNMEMKGEEDGDSEVAVSSEGGNSQSRLFKACSSMSLPFVESNQDGYSQEFAPVSRAISAIPAERQQL